MPGQPQTRTLQQSIEEYGRGIAGGLLFSLPLLYTMEMWWASYITHPSRLLAYVLATFGLLLAYNRFAGLREEASYLEVVIDSVEEMGIGLLVAGVFLCLMHRIHSAMPLDEIARMVILEAMTVAIGVSVGTAQLGAEPSSGEQSENNQEEENAKESDSNTQCQRNKSDGASSDNHLEETEEQIPGFFKQIALSLCGAVLIAANVGPTEEIIMLATETPPVKLLALACFSLLLNVLILHYSDFRGTRQYAFKGQGVLEVGRHAIMTYAVALLVSGAICWFFGRFDGVSLEIAVSQTVVLAFPAILGASAGRLLLQSN